MRHARVARLRRHDLHWSAVGSDPVNGVANLITPQCSQQRCERLMNDPRSTAEAFDPGKCKSGA
jgi:hypothetical protein